MNPRAFMRRTDPFAVLSFLVPLSIYLLTLAPSVTFFDSGEFITATSSLGISHSPGYPLFINYAKPFTFLPFGNVAFRVNLATAISAAGACFMVYLLTLYLLSGQELPGGERFSRMGRRFTSLCAAVTFAGSARLWLQSNHDKPYPLLSAICAVVFFLMLLWRESYAAGEERPSYVYLGAFLCGLGTGAHQIMVLMIPSYAYLLLSMDRRVIFRVKELVLAFAFAILGFSIHLHLVVRALQKPLLNWGDPKNLTQFLWNLLRKGYPMDRPVRTLQLLWAQINAFNVPYEYTLVGLFLLILGLAVTLRRHRDVVIAYLIGIVSFLVVIAGYFDTPMDMIFLTEEFFTPLYLLSAVFIGLALFELVRLLLEWLPRLAVPALRWVPCLLLAALPVSVCLLHYVENDQHENYIAFDYATNSLRSLPQGAVYFTWGDSGAFPLWYLQGVEKMREDLDLLHTPHLVFDWYLDGFPALFTHSVLRSLPIEQMAPENVLFLAASEQYPRRPVYVDFSTRYSVPFNEYQPHQRGICYQLIRQGTPLTPPDPDVWSLYALRGISGDMFFRDLDTGKAIQIYASSHLEAGETLLGMGFAPAGYSQLQSAQKIAPELGGQVSQLLNRYGMH